MGGGGGSGQFFSMYKVISHFDFAAHIKISIFIVARKSYGR